MNVTAVSSVYKSAVISSIIIVDVLQCYHDKFNFRVSGKFFSKLECNKEFVYSRGGSTKATQELARSHFDINHLKHQLVRFSVQERNGKRELCSLLYASVTKRCSLYDVSMAFSLGNTRTHTVRTFNIKEVLI